MWLFAMLLVGLACLAFGIRAVLASFAFVGVVGIGCLILLVGRIL